MKNKPLLLAVAVFVALLAAYFGTRKEHVAVGVRTFAWPSLTLEQVAAIEVSGSHRALLERGPEGWTVASPDAPAAKHRADEGLVRSLVEALADLHAPSLVSERAAKHAEYEVDAEKGTRLELRTTEGKRHALILGKPGRTVGTYLRSADDDAVFLTSVALAWQARKDVNGWRDRALRTVAAGDLARVVVTHPDGHTFALKAEEGGAWALESEAPKGYRFDPSAAQRLVAQVTGLRAQDFVTGDAPDFSKAVQLRLERKDGVAVAVALGAKRADGQWPVAIEGVPEPALLAGWTGDQLAKRLDELRDTTLFAFDVTSVQRLSLDVGGKATVVEKQGGLWSLVAPKPPPEGVTFDAAQVPAVLSRLKGLRAAKLSAESNPKVTGLAKPTGQVVVTLEGGATQRLALGVTAPDGTVYARGAADEHTWLLPAHERDWLARGVEVYAPPPPAPAFGGNGLDQLPPEIRKQLEAQLGVR